MYLGERLETADASFAMTGAVPAISTISERRSALRYVEARALGDGPAFAKDERVRGHEFHYSRTRYDRARHAFALEDGGEGYAAGNLHASYVHLHLGAYPRAVRRFLARARAFRGST